MVTLNKSRGNRVESGFTPAKSEVTFSKSEAGLIYFFRKSVNYLPALYLEMRLLCLKDCREQQLKHSRHQIRKAN